MARGSFEYNGSSSACDLGLKVCGHGIFKRSASSYVFFLFHAHRTVFHSGVVTRKNVDSSSRWRENAATVSSRVGNKTQPFKLNRRPVSRTASTVFRSSRRSATRVTRVTYLEKNETEN